jgi:hypothetical protein
VQTDVAAELNRIGDIQMVMAIATAILALFALAIAAAALFAVLKVRKAMERGLDVLPAKTDPIVTAASRIMGNLEDISERLKTGADSVEERVKRFGVVVDVVQEKAEDLLLDAASTAQGVHTAAEVLRDKKRSSLRPADRDLDEDVFDE